jgi:hypothetical protein
MCPPLVEKRWPQHAYLAGSWVSPRWAGKDAGRDLAGDPAFHYHGRASIAGQRCAHPSPREEDMKASGRLGLGPLSLLLVFSSSAAAQTGSKSKTVRLTNQQNAPAEVYINFAADSVLSTR